jgi:hypothetical protein
VPWPLHCLASIILPGKSCQTQNPHDQDLDGYATVGYRGATYK